MIGGYGPDKSFLPRVIHISVARQGDDLPHSGQPQDFVVTIHEEGTALTWQQNVTLDPKIEVSFSDAVQELSLWSLNLGLTPERAKQRAKDLGLQLYHTFLGQQGEEYLQRFFADQAPTAVHLDVDEMMLDLPWELLRDSALPIVERAPLGRLVRTHVIPRPGRDPIKEDTVVNILAVANPTADVPASDAEIAALTDLNGQRNKYTINVTMLQREDATRSEFRRLLASGTFDIVHFAGHASYDPAQPGTSALIFADGPLSADEVLGLEWAQPPYLVFNSACQSGRATGGRRLVSEQNQGNGLAAAFLATGCLAYAGYFWPVSDDGAGLFARTFYSSLFEFENVGEAFKVARVEALRELGEQGDLTGYGAILYGDAGTKERRDVFTAA